MTDVLRSLKNFKQFLRTPSTRIQIVHNTPIDRQPPPMREAYRKKGLYEPPPSARSPRRLRCSTCPTTSKVWLYWDRGTRKWRFSGDTVALPLNAALEAPDEVVYRCSIDGARAGMPAPKEDALQRS